MSSIGNIKQEKRSKGKVILKAHTQSIPIRELLNITHFLKDFGRRVIKEVNKKKGRLLWKS